MTSRAYRTYQALLVGGLGIFLLGKIWDGTILFYLNQRYIFLVLLAGLGLLIISQALLRERPVMVLLKHQHATVNVEQVHPDERHSPSASNLFWLAIPLILGLVIPARPLGLTALEYRGVNSSSPLVANSGEAARALEISPRERTVLDWIRAFSAAPNAGVIEDQPVDVTGFVFHDPALPPGWVMVGRFAITCCVADAMAFGLVVSWREAASLPDNTWVRVQGQVRIGQVGAKTMPYVLATDVEIIPQPEQPYLFP